MFASQWRQKRSEFRLTTSAKRRHNQRGIFTFFGGSRGRGQLSITGRCGQWPADGGQPSDDWPALRKSVDRQMSSAGAGGQRGRRTADRHSGPTDGQWPTEQTMTTPSSGHVTRSQALRNLNTRKRIRIMVHSWHLHLSKSICKKWTERVVIMLNNALSYTANDPLSQLHEIRHYIWPD